MRRFAVLLGVATLALAATGCNKLKARDHLNKGVQAYKVAQFNTAIEHFRQAIELDPSLINARLYLATAYASQYIPGAPSPENTKVGEQAIAEFKKVLEMDPNNIGSIKGIGGLYFNMNQMEDAKEWQRKLTVLEPNDPEPYYYIGVIDWTLSFKPRNELRNKLKLARPEDPIPVKPRLELAKSNGPVVEEGIEALKKAIEIKPDYIDALAYLNLLYREKADLVEAAERAGLTSQADAIVEKIKEIRGGKEGAAQ
jgi:tetratricopeptide (TPR) repeat protein